MILPPKSDPCALQLVVPNLWIIFTHFSKELLIIWNQILTNLYLEVEEVIWSLYQTGQKSQILPNCSVIIIFRLIDRGHNPRHGIWNDSICVVLTVSIYQNLLKGRRLRKPKTKHTLTLITNEKMTTAMISTSSHYRIPHRQELGLPTLSSAVHLQKMMPSTMFQSIQTFCERHIFGMLPF